MPEFSGSSRHGFFPDAPAAHDPAEFFRSGLTRRQALVTALYGSVALILGTRQVARVAESGLIPGLDLPNDANTAPDPLGPSLVGFDDANHEGVVFDTVIVGGRAIDPESGFDRVANVGIHNGLVAAVSASPLTGRREVSAASKVVCPGFVDVLSYEPKEFGVRLKLLDGVTTNLAMHGVSNYGAAFFNTYEGNCAVNFGGAFHHQFMRGAVLQARPDRPLEAAQLDRLVELARSGFAEGLAGISFSLEYAPGTTIPEVERLAAVAADSNQVCFFHVRHGAIEPLGPSLQAISEALDIGRRFGVAVHIQHITSTGGTRQMPAAIELIEQAQADGQDVSACFYPYDFWGTFSASARFSPGWQERFDLSYEDLQVAGTEQRLTEETFAAVQQANRLVVARGSIPAVDIRQAFDTPWTMLGSDAIPTSDLNNHPRGAGTFSRALGVYVRELDVIGLVGALAKMTILPAKRVEGMIPAMKKKGRLQVGADADLVVFDPASIRDVATVASPDRPSTGIEMVMVGGQIMVSQGRLEDAEPQGLALRGVAS